MVAATIGGVDWKRYGEMATGNACSAIPDERDRPPPSRDVMRNNLVEFKPRRDLDTAVGEPS